MNHRERAAKSRKGKIMEREQITIRLPAELKEKLQQEAGRRGDSLNGLIIMMLDKACEVMNQD